MKARHLILISMLSATSSVLAQNQDIIIEEALKATPAGFTDLVPHRSFPSPVIKQHPKTVHELRLKPVNLGNPTFAPPGNVEQPTTELDSILKSHQKENDDFINKLSKIFENPQ